MKLSEVPGLQEAVARETFLRDAAFLPVTENICGVKVKPLTFYHMTLLRVAKSPFLTGRKITAGDIAVFLWIVSTRYNPSSRLAQWRFGRSIRKLDAAKAVDEILTYLRESFQDSPGGSGAKTVSFYSTTAGLVDILASEYGWTEEAILHLPLKRGLQYLKAITKRLNPKATLSNPSQALLVPYLNSRSNVS